MLPGVRPDWGKLAKVSAKPDKGDKYVELLDGFNGMIRELVSENSVLREAIRISGPVFEAQQRFEKEQEVFEKYAGVKSVSEALDKVFATPEAAKQVSVAIHVWVDQSIKKIPLLEFCRQQLVCIAVVRLSKNFETCGTERIHPTKLDQMIDRIRQWPLFDPNTEFGAFGGMLMLTRAAKRLNQR